MSDASSLGNAFEGNVTPQIDPPQVGVGPDTDKVGAGVLAPKHPHWRNDPVTKQRMDSYAYQGDIRSRLDDLTALGDEHSNIGPA
jgi:hypothetical protein